LRCTGSYLIEGQNPTGGGVATVSYTPGPWEPIAQAGLADESRMYDIRYEHDATATAGYLRWGFVAKDVGEADARLIAAAPELLEALERIASLTDVNCDEAPIEARRAIAKAEGEPVRSGARNSER
jgi:hypothetical protein